MTQTNGTTTFDVLFDRDNRVNLITNDSNESQGQASSENTWHKGLDAETIMASIPMKVIAKTIDDLAWDRLVFFMKQRIARLREKEEAEANSLPPALFPVCHVDLPESIATFRLEMIGHFRHDNPDDLRSAVELIEVTTAHRHQRPVSREHLTDATWNRGLLEQRFLEDLDDLYAERNQQGDRFDQLYQDAALEPRPESGGLSDSEAQLLASIDYIRKLDYVLDHHTRQSPGLNVA